MELKNIFLFENLNDATINEIEKISSVMKLNKDNILFYEGEESKNIYILLKGVIKLYKVTSSDKEIILKYFKANEFIAEVASFEGIDYPATAQAFTECQVLKIDFNKLKELILSDSELAFIIMKSLITKIRNLENLVSMNMQLDSKQRVAKYVYLNEEEFFLTKNVQIAEILNMTPETLSRILKVFKDDGLIDTKKKSINKEGLRVYFS